MLTIAILSLCVGLANLYCMIVFVLPRTEMLNPRVDVFGESESTKDAEINSDADSGESASS